MSWRMFVEFPTFLPSLGWWLWRFLVVSWWIGWENCEERREKSRMIILCKWWVTRRTFMFYFTLGLYFSCHDRRLVFLSILMKIVCKQSSVRHSENCFFIVDFEEGNYFHCFSLTRSFFFSLQLSTRKEKRRIISAVVEEKLSLKEMKFKSLI